MTPPTPTPKQQWESLRMYILDRTAEIDAGTPMTRSGVEPQWWLDMMAVQNVARNRAPK